jgi:hypothetical protein
MTKNLESLSAFESKSINKLEMKNVMGGVASSTITGGGSYQVNMANCQTINVTYTSDINQGTGANGRPLMEYCGEVASYA